MQHAKMQHRQDSLESKIAHLELGLEELSQVVYAQSKQIDFLQAQIKQFQSKLSEAVDEAPAPASTAADERPPHY